MGLQRWVQRAYAKWGLWYPALIIALGGTVIYLLAQPEPVSGAQLIIVIGLVGTLSVVHTQDEIKFREQRRSAFVGAVAAMMHYSDCFDHEGLPVDEIATRESRERALIACAKVSLLFRRVDTQQALDMMMRDVSRLEAANRSGPWEVRHANAHNSIQRFIRASREELGMSSGRMDLLPVPCPDCSTFMRVEEPPVERGGGGRLGWNVAKDPERLIKFTCLSCAKSFDPQLRPLQ